MRTIDADKLYELIAIYTRPQLHDLVCSGDHDGPIGGSCCSCLGRHQRAIEAAFPQAPVPPPASEPDSEIPEAVYEAGAQRYAKEFGRDVLGSINWRRTVEAAVRTDRRLTDHRIKLLELGRDRHVEKIERLMAEIAGLRSKACGTTSSAPLSSSSPSSSGTSSPGGSEPDAGGATDEELSEAYNVGSNCWTAGAAPHTHGLRAVYDLGRKRARVVSGDDYQRAIVRIANSEVIGTVLKDLLASAGVHITP